MTRAGKGASLSAVKSPAIPAPRTMAPGASMVLSAARIAPSGGKPVRRSGSNSQHAFDGRPRTRGNCRFDRYLDAHGFQRPQDARQRDPLHVRAEIAGPYELDVRKFDGDVVAHRTLRDHDDARGPMFADVGNHCG